MRTEFDDPAYMNVPKDWDWPPALVKATCDPFSYSAFIRGLGWIDFGGASAISKRWVSLDIEQPFRPDDYPSLKGRCCERGLQVQVSDIIAVVDAPRGS